MPPGRKEDFYENHDFKMHIQPNESGVGKAGVRRKSHNLQHLLLHHIVLSVFSPDLNLRISSTLAESLRLSWYRVQRGISRNDYAISRKLNNLVSVARSEDQIHISCCTAILPRFHRLLAEME